MWFGTVALHGASPVRFRVNVCVHQICSYLSIGYSRIKLYSSLFVTVLFGVWLAGYAHLNDIQRRRRRRRRLWRHQQTLTINTAEERKSQKEPKQRKPHWRQTHKPRRTRLSYVVYQWPSSQLRCWRQSAMFVCKLLQWHNGHESGRSQPTCHDDIILKVQLTFYGVALLSKLSDHYCQNYVYAGHKS